MSDGVSGGSGGLPVAGWYPDPAGTQQERWWGGIDWTDHLRDVPAAAPVWPPAAPEWGPTVAAAASTRTASGMPAAPFQPAYTPMAGFGTADTDRGRFYRPPTGSPNTGPIWLLAFSPILGVIALIGLVLAPADVFIPALVALSIVQFVGTLVIVIADSAILRARGYAAASALWILLGLVIYLIMRSIALGRAGVNSAAPAIALAISAVLAGAVGYGAGSGVFLGPQVGYQQDAFAMARLETQTEEYLVNETSQEWTVACPTDIDPSVIGTEFECTATLVSSGSSRSITVKVIAPRQFEITPIS